MRALRRAIAALAVLGVVLCSGCDASPAALSWRLRFSDPALEARVSLVETQIRRGGCDSSEVVYQSLFDMDGQPPAPAPLDEGRYGFFARTLDDECRWYAVGCHELRLPRDDSSRVTVELAQIAEAEPDCVACRDPRCGAAALDAGSDAADRVDAASAVDAPPPRRPPLLVRRFVLRIEAEAASQILPPFEILDDENASGGKYIAYPYDPASELPITEFRRQEPPTLESDGLATYDFTVPRSGSYRLWALVITPNLDEDSFWFKMDDQAWILWNDIFHATSYEWVDIRDFDRRVQMLVFELDAGPHRLTVGYRELNARLDQLLITDELDLTPTN